MEELFGAGSAVLGRTSLPIKRERKFDGVKNGTQTQKERMNADFCFEIVNCALSII